MRMKRLSARITSNVAAPMANAVQLVLPSRIAWMIAQMLRSGPSLSILKPNSFGSWLISTVSAMPFM